MTDHDPNGKAKPTPPFFLSLLLGSALCLLPWFSYAAVFSLSGSDIAAMLCFFLLAAVQLVVLAGIDLHNRVGSDAPLKCLFPALGYLIGALVASAVVYLVLIFGGDTLLPFFTDESMLPGPVYLFMLLLWLPVLAADALWVALSALIHGPVVRHHKKRIAQSRMGASGNEENKQQ